MSPGGEDARAGEQVRLRSRVTDYLDAREVAGETGEHTRCGPNRQNNSHLFVNEQHSELHKEFVGELVSEHVSEFKVHLGYVSVARTSPGVCASRCGAGASIGLPCTYMRKGCIFGGICVARRSAGGRLFGSAPSAAAAGAFDRLPPPSSHAPALPLCLSLATAYGRLSLLPQ
eukprot:2314342-Pleurochrysis_carterae.AAC.2